MAVETLVREKQRRAKRRERPGINTEFATPRWYLTLFLGFLHALDFF
jgi:hypothetical protein